MSEDRVPYASAATVEMIRKHYPEDRLLAALMAFGIPALMHEGYIRYVREGIVPGSFLQAVIAGDLFDAVARADEDNQVTLAQHVKFIVNHMPVTAWGSREKVADYVVMFSEWRERQRHADVAEPLRTVVNGICPEEE